MADDDFTASSLELAVVLIAIVSCLILVTIIFELTKDYAVSCGNKYTRFVDSLNADCLFLVF